MRHRCALFVLPVLVVLVLCSGCATVQVTRDIDPKAEDILKTMGATIAGARQFSFKVRSTMDEPIEGGPMVERASQGRISVSRPNKVFASRSGDLVTRDVWYDGSTLTVFDKNQNAYAAVKAPPTIDKMLDFAMDEYDLIVPLADILFSDPYAVLVENVESCQYLGLHKAGSRPCQHLIFHQKLIDWQIWIDAGKDPLPLKIVITYLDSPEKPQYRATLSGWELSPELQKDLFDFQPPPGADRVDMDALLGHKEGADR